MIVALTVLACPVSCSSDEPEDPHAARALPAIAVSDQPTLTLADEGSEDVAFANVTARRLPGGAVVVGSRGTREILLFDRRGGFRQRLARQGKGPGEMSGNFALALNGDSIFAIAQPPSPGDVSVYLPDSGFVMRVRPAADNAPTGMVVLDRLPSGPFLVRQGRGFAVLQSIPPAGTLTPDSLTYGLLSLMGDDEKGTVRWLSPELARWSLSYPWPGGPIPTTQGPYPFGPMILPVPSADRLWMISTDSGQLRAIDASGRVVVSARIPLEPKPFDRQLLESRRDHELRLAARAIDTARIRAVYEPDRAPQVAPLVSAGYAGNDGEIWVRLFNVDAAAPQQFVVVDSSGRPVARATLPAGLEIHQIGADFVIGVREDSLGVESVVEYSLRR